MLGFAPPAQKFTDRQGPSSLHVMDKHHQWIMPHVWRQWHRHQLFRRVVLVLGIVCAYHYCASWSERLTSKRPNGFAVSRSERHSRVGSPLLPPILLEDVSSIQDCARRALVLGAADHGNVSSSQSPQSPFAHVLTSLPIARVLLHQPRDSDADDKVFVGPDVLRMRGCIVYAAGISNTVGFEENIIQNLGCEVHGFDCTLTSADPGWKFEFHDWCIGKPHGFDGNLYSTPKAAYGQNFVFKTLKSIRATLGHDRIDILKLDIEGSEWAVLEDLLDLPDDELPAQLLFELHTEGANSLFVPSSLVAGKDSRAVAALFLRLHDRGYRVIHMEPNSGDPKCADFSLVRLR